MQLWECSWKSCRLGLNASGSGPDAASAVVAVVVTSVDVQRCQNSNWQAKSRTESEQAWGWVTVFTPETKLRNWCNMWISTSEKSLLRDKTACLWRGGRIQKEMFAWRQWVEIEMGGGLRQEQTVGYSFWCRHWLFLYCLLPELSIKHALWCLGSLNRKNLNVYPCFTEFSKTQEIAILKKKKEKILTLIYFLVVHSVKDN